ncbi:MAG: glutathione S-transferase N-terminal domain-containing protein [Myxococcota bacterium]
MELLTLVTIPLSHYCEKARWALDLAGLAYREEGHLPLLHMLGTRRRGGRSVPLLVTPEVTLRDSSDILAWIDARSPLYPTGAEARSEALALEDHFDEKLGPHVRRVGYFYMLPHRALATRVVSAGTARWERGVAAPLFPVLRAIMRRGLRITPEASARSLAKVRAGFAEVGARLADGRKYLVGDAFSAADLTFAALVGPLVNPPEHPVTWPTEAELPDDLRALSDELRATAAGQFALRIYREHRGAPTRLV